MYHVTRKCLLVGAMAILLSMNAGCIFRLPFNQTQTFPFPDGAYDVSIGGAGEDVFEVTVPITALCELPTEEDILDLFYEEGGGHPATRPLLTVKRALFESLSVRFDGYPFSHNDIITVRLLGHNDVELDSYTPIDVPPGEFTIPLNPITEIDILDYDLSLGECLDVQFIFTGKNPYADIPVTATMTLEVEFETRGLIPFPMEILTEILAPQYRGNDAVVLSQR